MNISHEIQLAINLTQASDEFDEKHVLFNAGKVDKDEFLRALDAVKDEHSYLIRRNIRMLRHYESIEKSLKS